MSSRNIHYSDTDPRIAEAMKDQREQKGPFKKTRANQTLTRGEVVAIKAGRKKLRAEMRARGIRSKKEFELTASSLGLYFDKGRFLAFWLWWTNGKGITMLIGAAIMLLTVLFMLSTVTQMQGHFTINMSDKLFAEGFSLSETEDFEDPKARLFCDPAIDVPCFSIMDIHSDVDEVDGQHNEAEYFAYTFYVRNEGESTVGYTWTLAINSESKDLSKATWFMIFEDGEMNFYAEEREDGTQEALPYFNDNTRGYGEIPFEDVLGDVDDQAELITTKGNRNYYRLIPYSFDSRLIAEGSMEEVEPMDVHKYTVVFWLEGDDPDCTNDLIGGHLGVDMQFQLVTEETEEEQEESWLDRNWEDFWDGLLFMDDMEEIEE